MGFSKVVAGNQNLQSQIKRPSSRSSDAMELTPDAPYSAGDATKYLAQNVRSAQRLLTAGEGGFSSQEQRQLEEIADKGFRERAGSGLATLFNWLDRPRKLVQLGIRDITGFDERRDTEITAGDYWSALSGDNEALVERLGEDVVGEGGNLGTSQLLDDVWHLDEDTPTWARIARGAVSFGGDVVTDPLSYVTGGQSGAGRQAAAEAAEVSVRQAAAKAAVRLSDEMGVGVTEGIRRLAGDIGEAVADDALERGILARARSVADDAVEQLRGELDPVLASQAGIDSALDAAVERTVREAVGLDEAGRLLGRDLAAGEARSAAAEIMDEIARRQATRTFGFGKEGFDDSIWRAYTEHVIGTGGPMSTLGGVRFGVPLAYNSTTRPFLQGSGRTIRETLGKLPPFKTPTARRWVEKMEHWGAKLDAGKPALLAAKSGEYTSFKAVMREGARMGQKFQHLGAAGAKAIDDMETAIRREVGGVRTSVEDMQSYMDDAYRAVTNAIQRGDSVPSPEDLARFTGKAREAVVAAVQPVRQAYDDAWATLKEVIPTLGRLEGHVPLYLDRGFTNVMGELLSKAHRLSLPNSLADAEHLATELGVEVSDMVRFVEVQAALDPSIPSGASLGWVQEFNKRTTGRTVDMAPTERLLDTDLVMLQPSKQNINDINESLMKVLSAYVEKRNLAVSLKKVGNAVVLDPGQQLTTYITATQGAAIQRAIEKAGRQYGLIRDMEHIELVERLASQVSEDVLPAVKKIATRMLERSERGLAETAERFEALATKKIRIRGNLYVEVPEVVANSRGVQQAIDRVRRNLEKVERIKGAAAAGRKRQTDRLLREVPSLSEAEANQLVSLTSEALQDLRTTMFDEAVRIQDEVSQVLVDALGSGRVTQEAFLEAAGEQRALAGELERLMGELEQQWDNQFRSVKETVPDVPITQYAPDGTIDDVATVQILSDEILSPITVKTRKHLESKARLLGERRERVLANAERAGLPPSHPIVDARLEAVEAERILVDMLSSGSVSRADVDFQVRKVAAARYAEAGAMLDDADWSTAIGNAVEFLSDSNLFPDLTERGLSLYKGWREGGMVLSDSVARELDIHRLVAVGHMLEDGKASAFRGLRNADTIAEQRTILDEVLATTRTNASYMDEAASLTTAARHQVQESAKRLRDEYGALTLSRSGESFAGRKPLVALAQIYSDPSALDAVVQDLDVINDLIRRVLRADGELTVTVDAAGNPRLGMLMDAARDSGERTAPSLREAADALNDGRIVPGMLKDQDVAMVKTYAAMRRQMRDLYRGVGNAKRLSSRKLTELGEIQKLMDEFQTLTTRVMRGERRADTLKNWAYDSGGKPTPKLLQLERFMNRQGTATVALRRSVDALILSSETASPIARRVLAQNEARWADNALQPLERSIENLQSVIQDVALAAREAEDDVYRGMYEYAQHFIEEVSGFNEALLATSNTNGGAVAVQFAGADLAARRRAVAQAASALNTQTKAERKVVAKLKEALLNTDEVRNIPEGFQPAAAFGIGGDLEGSIVDEYLGLAFENMVATTKALHTPWGLRQLQDTTHGLIKWWKGAATVSKPSFHFRNLISGVANGMLIGVGPQNYARISRPLVTFRSMVADAVDPAEIFRVIGQKHGDDMAELFEAAWKQNVFQGFSRAERLADTAARGISGGANLLRNDNELFRTGGRVMETFEDFMRIAAFDRHYAGYGTEALAAQMVVVAHFDYTNLTMLEKRFKKIAPFFVWTRRNLPLQLQMLMERPGMINIWNHLQRATQGQMGEDPFPGMPLNAYMSPLAVKLSGEANDDSPFWARMIWDPDLPVRILDDVPLFTKDNPAGILPMQLGSAPEWFNWAAGLFGPQISLPLDIREQADYGDVAAPRGLAEILRAVEAIPGVDFESVDTSGDTTMISRWARQTFETGIPFYQEYRRWLGFTSTDPSRQAAEGDLTAEGELDTEDVWSYGLDELINPAVRGFGGGRYQTPYDAKAPAWEAQQIVSDIRSRLANATP